jgi:TPR repeat protein
MGTERVVASLDHQLRDCQGDYAEAAKWYRLAAEQGYADAINNLNDLKKWGC